MVSIFATYMRKTICYIIKVVRGDFDVRRIKMQQCDDDDDRFDALARVSQL